MTMKLILVAAAAMLATSAHAEKRAIHHRHHQALRLADSFCDGGLCERVYDRHTGASSLDRPGAGRPKLASENRYVIRIERERPASGKQMRKSLLARR